MEVKEVRGEKRERTKKGLDYGRIFDDLAGVWGR
jgi:hypothetical protein